MAFKGAWHRADGSNNNAAGGSGDRRYSSSNDSYNNYSHPPQNQMGLPPMNYSNNSNSMYQGMNAGPGMMSANNYSSGGKSLPYTGTISNMFRDFGVIDNEISFKLNAVSGPLPRVGDRVVCQMKTADAFGPATPYKYYGFEVRAAQSPAENRRGRPSGGSQGMNRNSDSFGNRNGNRGQSSSLKRPLPTNNNNNNNNNSNHSQSSSFGSNHRDRHRSSPVRSTKPLPAKRTSRAPPPKYICTLPKACLNNSELNFIDIRSRYSRLHIPSNFFHTSYLWHQTIPLDHPLKFISPSSFHLFPKNVPRLINNTKTSVLDPEDADYSWSVRVMLMSNPDVQTLIQRSCQLTSEKKSPINLDDLEHPSKLIKFLVGVRHQNEYFPLGGPWSPSLDGENPDRDPQVLIRTAIRCVHAQTGIDLSKCLQWCRYLEVRYHRPEEVYKGRLIESRYENVVVFLPDIASTCMPNSLEWEEISGLYKQSCENELAEELNEHPSNDNDNLSTDEISSTHYSQLQIDQLNTQQLRNELKARGSSITGIKLDLKRRLTKLVQQEKDADELQTKDESTPMETTKTEEKEHSAAEIEKIRKDIELKYQMPTNRSILAHPTDAKGDKFDCRVVSLHYLLNYANKDTIHEKCFELYLFSESFFEMLMRDSIYKIYRSLHSCLEVTETPTTTTTTTTTTNNPDDVEVTTNNDEIETDENAKKRKRSPSKEDDATQRKKNNVEENSRLKTIHPELLFAFTFFDRNRCGYLTEKDLEELLLHGGLALTKNEASKFVTRFAQDEMIRYHKLTDKMSPMDAEENDEMPIELEIDAQAPKGNLLHLPSFSSNDDNFMKSSADDQRAMKQLELSTKIQTGLELKIEAMRKTIQNLTDELETTQETSRTTNEQLIETKKRLRDVQHDLKSAEEKYQRYSDVLYRLRSESRSTFENLTHVLGIKEKQSSQTHKNDDETKKSSKPTSEEVETEAKPTEEQIQND